MYMKDATRIIGVYVGELPSLVAKYCIGKVLQQILTKEKSSPGSIHDNLFWRQTKNFHQTRQLLYFILTRKQRISGVQFCQNTTC